MFLTDNGTPAWVATPPYVEQHTKGTLYQGGIHVPLLVTGPGVAVPGSECVGLVTTTDLFATVAELAGVDLAATLPGVTLDSVSFAPYLGDPTQPSIRTVAFSEAFRPLAPAGLCQHDAGLGSAGAATLSVCGEPLAKGKAATLTLDGTGPDAPCTFLVSLNWAPTEVQGLLLAPIVDFLMVNLVADAEGRVVLEVPGAQGFMTPLPTDIFLQALHPDPDQPGMLLASNAVRLRIPAEKDQYHVVTIRDERFKLIRTLDVSSRTLTLYGHARDQFYDLWVDPYEAVDLMTLLPLDPFHKARFDALVEQLEQLLPAP
jgi:arylsulfatase A-like enzyme